MLAIGVFLTRVIAFLAGALCLYVSMFTKDNDGKVQNWLVSLWITVEAHSELRGSRAVALLSGAASKINVVLDRVFGAGLWSLRFIVTSSSLSIASLYLLTSLRFLLGKDIPSSARYAEAVLVCLLLANAVIAWPRRSVTLGAGIFAILFLFWTENGQTASFRNAFAGICLGILLDWGFVGISRLTLRKLERGRTLSQTVLPAVLNTILGLILLAPASLFVSYRLWCVLPFTATHLSDTVGLAEWIVAIASATNLVAGLCALSLLIVVTVALFHRFFWPFVSQMVHVCYERKVIERRMLFFTAGSTHVTYAFGWLSWLVKVPKFLLF
jgi:hypothetical protein